MFNGLREFLIKWLAGTSFRVIPGDMEIQRRLGNLLDEAVGYEVAWLKKAASLEKAHKEGGSDPELVTKVSAWLKDITENREACWIKIRNQLGVNDFDTLFKERVNNRLKPLTWDVVNNNYAWLMNPIPDYYNNYMNPKDSAKK